MDQDELKAKIATLQQKIEQAAANLERALDTGESNVVVRAYSTLLQTRSAQLYHLQCSQGAAKAAESKAAEGAAKAAVAAAAKPAAAAEAAAAEDRYVAPRKWEEWAGSSEQYTPILEPGGKEQRHWLDPMWWLSGWLQLLAPNMKKQKQN